MKRINWKPAIKWSAVITVTTLLLAALFSVASTLILTDSPLALGIVVVLIIIFIGVIFDVVGIAAAAADVVPFQAMATNKVIGAKEALHICKHADRVSNFCNDVIGDISGIVSGTASAVVILQLIIAMGYAEDSTPHVITGVIFTSLVAGLTVGSKALGKSIAITYSTPIILGVGKVFYFIDQKLHISLLNGKTKQKVHSHRRRKNSRGNR